MQELQSGAFHELQLYAAKAPEWVQLLPLGNVATNDGRAFVADDPDAIVDAFEAGGLDLPVDFEHQNDNPVALAAGPVKAAGWIKELMHDTLHVYGRVEWTPTAASMIATREYRYLSPSMIVEKDTRRVLKLKGAALVHNPALRLTALAREETPMATDADKPAGGTLLAKMAQLFDQPETASESDVILKVAQLMIAPGAKAAEPDPAKYVPAQAVETMMAQRNHGLATAREDRIARKVTEALTAGAFLPPQKDWALALGRADEAALDTFIAKCGMPYGYLKRELRHLNGPPPGAGSLFSDAEVAVSAQLGLKPEALR